MESDGWQRYESGNEAPGNIGVFHKAVIDPKQPGSHRILSAKMRTNKQFTGMHLGTVSTSAALSRVYYRGWFHIPDDYNHLKVCEFPSLSTRKFVI
jgi:hypothetical protein